MLFTFIPVLLAFSQNSCQYEPELFQGALQSDGYLKYFSNGATVTVADSVKGADPAYFLLTGYYFRSTAFLELEAHATSSNQDLRLHLINCHDTGIFVLDAPGRSSASLNGWTTDSSHQGLVHITLFDTLNRKVSGTFRFTAFNKISSPDSIIVDSGTFYHFPIKLAQ